MSETILFDYWRSSASYRVRIALNLKGITYRAAAIDLVSMQQRTPEFTARNPQGFVPLLHIDGHDLIQSLAIIEYLDATRPDPRLLPTDPAARAETLAQAMIIIADIHPVNNLRMLRYLKTELGHDQATVDIWYRHWISEGFAALEAFAPDQALFGGAQPNLTDVCLTPQMANARRFEVDLAPFPRLVRIDAQLQAIPAFAAAHPDAVRPG